MRRRVRAERARANDLEAEQRTVHTKLTVPAEPASQPIVPPRLGGTEADPWRADEAVPDRHPVTEVRDQAPAGCIEAAGRQIPTLARRSTALRRPVGPGFSHRLVTLTLPSHAVLDVVVDYEVQFLVCQTVVPRQRSVDFVDNWFAQL